ncbi:MAG: TolC family protein [Victivallaceae bacterium]|nr:TolC family protein [Victivallaceae bacterium]MDD4180527.1 TolC family protein [Victivallaceae bacterium]
MSNKKSRIFYLLAASAALVGLCNGCYRYTPPPAVFGNNVFSEHVKDKGERDNLLKGITILNLDMAQEIAVKNNPDYISAYHAVSAARMRYYQALNAYLPEFTAKFGINAGGDEYYNRDVGTSVRESRFNTSTSLNASWLIFDGLVRTMDVMRTKHSWQAENELEEDTRRLLMSSVAYAFNDILLARGRYKIAEADRDFQMKNLYQTQLKYEAGAVPLSDVLNFKIAVNTATGDQLSAEYSYNVAIYSLAVLMGYYEGTLPDSIEFPPIKADTDEHVSTVEVYLDIALNNRPDLQYYREMVKMSEYSLYSAYGAYSPVVRANASVGFNTNAAKTTRNPGGGNISNRSYNNNPGYNIGVTAEWLLPLEWRRAARVQEAQADIAKAKFHVASNWLQVVEEVRTSYDNYIQNVRLARLYETTLSLVTKQRDLVEEEYNAGNTELTRLNEAQLKYVQAENEMINSLVNVQKAIAQLRSATHTSPIGARVEQLPAQNLPR